MFRTFVWCFASVAHYKIGFLFHCYLICHRGMKGYLTFLDRNLCPLLRKVKNTGLEN